MSHTIKATLEDIESFWRGRTRPPGDDDPGEYAVTFCYGDDTVRIYGSCLIIARDARALLSRLDEVVSAEHDPRHGATIIVKATAWGGTHFKRQMSEEQREAAGKRLAAARAAGGGP